MKSIHKELNEQQEKECSFGHFWAIYSPKSPQGSRPGFFLGSKTYNLHAQYRVVGFYNFLEKSNEGIKS